MLATTVRVDVMAPLELSSEEEELKAELSDRDGMFGG